MSISIGAVSVSPSTIVTGQPHAVTCAVVFNGEPSGDYSFQVDFHSKSAGGNWEGSKNRVLFDTNDGDGVGQGGFEGNAAYAVITMVGMSGTRTVNLNLKMYFDNNTSQPPGTYHMYRIRVRVVKNNTNIAIGNWATFSTGFSLNRYNAYAIPQTFATSWTHGVARNTEFQFLMDNFPTWDRVFVKYQREYFNQVTQQWQVCDAGHPVVWLTDLSSAFVSGGQSNNAEFSGLYNLASGTQDAVGKPQIAFSVAGSYRIKTRLHPKLNTAGSTFARYALFDISSYVSDWKNFTVS